jgi:CMP-N-acetylneuraminic acid synthetase
LDSIKALKIDIPVYVSTDSEKIAEIVTKYSGVNLIWRPKELSTDTATTEDALLHVIESVAFKVNWVVTLPPTSPFRLASTISEFIDVVNSIPDKVDCLMSVTETKGDFWRFKNSERFTRLFPGAPRRQQDRNSLYEENSAIYINKVSKLMTKKSIIDGTVLPKTISKIEAFDINTFDDVEMARIIAESILRKNET